MISNLSRRRAVPTFRSAWVSASFAALSATAFALVAVPFARAATEFYDSDGNPANGVTDGNGNFNLVTPTFLIGTGGTTEITPVVNDTLQFGNTGAGNYTVTLNGGRDLYLGTNNVTFNQNYTLTAATVSDGIGVSAITVATGKTAAINAYLSFSGGGTIGADSTFSLSGGGNLNGYTGNGTSAAAGSVATFNIGTGYYTEGSNTFTGGGATFLTMNVNSGAFFRVATGNFGTSTTGGTTFNVNTGSVFNATALNLGQGVAATGYTGTTTAVFGTVGATTGPDTYINGGVIVGNGTVATSNGGNAVLTLNSGSFNANGTVSVGTVVNANNVIVDTLNLNGGVDYFKGITLGSTSTTYKAGSTATINLAGSTLYLGTSGATFAAGTGLTTAFNYSAGLLGAIGTASVATPITLSGTGGTFQAAAGDGTSQSITLTGIIADASGATTGLTKTGIGTLFLTAANTYTGTTTVNAGTLNIGNGTATGSISASSPLVMNGGALTLTTTGGVTQTFAGASFNGGNAGVTNSVAADTLALGAVSHTAGGTAAFTFTGPITTTTANTNGIVGPWATTGTGSSMAYVTSAGTGTVAGNLSAYAGATTATAANLTSETTNFNATGSLTLTGNSSAYTLRAITSGNATVALGANTLTVNGLMNAVGSGTENFTASTGGGIIIGSTKELDVLGSNGITINAPISNNAAGASALVNSGTGTATLTLTGANTYTGGTFLNGGFTQLSSAETAGTSGPLGASGNIVFNGGQLRFGTVNAFDYSSRIKNSLGAVSLDTSGQTVTFASPIDSSNTGGLLATSTTAGGKLVLSAANTYTGLTFVTSGITSATASTVQLSGAGTLGATTNALDVAGGGTGQIATLDLNGTNQTVGTFYGSNTGVVTNTSATASVLTVGNNNGVNPTYAGALSGNLGLTKVGSGTNLTLSGTLSNTGPTIVNGGGLNYNTAASFATTSQVTVNDGGYVQLNAGSATTTSTLLLTIGGMGTVGVTDAINSNGNNTFAGNITVTDHTAIAVSAGSTFNIGTAANSNTLATNGYNVSFDTASGTFNVYSTITGGGGILRIGTTPTTYTNLYGTNTYTGNTTVSTGGGGSGSGAFRAFSNQAFGVNSALVLITPAAGTLSAIDLNGFDNAFGSLGGSTSRGFSNLYLGGATLTTGGDNTSTTFGANISSASPLITSPSTGGGLVKIGTGTQTLTGNNGVAFTGTTTVNGGTLAASSGPATTTTAPGQATTTNGTTGAFAVGATTIVVTSNTNFAVGESISGTGIAPNTIISGVSGTTVTLNTATTGAGTAGEAILAGAPTSAGATVLVLGNGNSLLVGEGISGTGIASGSTVSIINGNLLTLSSPITAGTAGETVTAAAYQSLGSGALVMGNNAGATLDLSIGTGATTVGSIAGGGALGGNIALGATTLTTGANNTSTTFGGVITSTAALTTPSLVKTGTGALTLTGASTYSGTTTVNAGALLLTNTTGSGTGTGAVNVTGTGTILGGTGAASGNVTIGSGAIVLGGTAGTPSGALTLTGTTTLSSGSIIELTLGAGGVHSTLALTGAALPGGQIFTLLNSQPGTYDNIITGVSSGDGSTFTATNTDFTYTFANDGMGDIDLTVTAVPEPSTWVAGLLCLGTLGFSQRRRVQSWLRLARHSVEG